MRGRTVWGVVAILAVPAGAAGQAAVTTTTGAAAAAATITAAELRADLGVLAHDSMRGRDTPSPELMETAHWVEAQFRAAGLEPGADASFQQLYPLTRLRSAGTDVQSLRFEGPSGAVELRWGDEFFARPVPGALQAAGPLVAASDPTDLSAAAGAVAVVHLTPGNIRQIFSGALAAAAREARPAAVLVVMQIPDNSYDRLRAFLSGDRISAGEVESDGVPAVYVKHSALPAPLAEALAGGEPLPDGWSAEVRTAGAAETVEAPNTIGILRGSDPELRDEYVLFTAHMDHVGVGTPVGGDSIYNGANDNASGTVTVVELAEAFASLPTPPRRSLAFMTVSGEEKGLLGSRWYAEHPTIPIERIVANINIDMVGRNWQDTIVAIGKQESSLGPLMERVASEHPELGLAVIDDRWPEQSFYTRSDHYNFARRGVPILFFFNGVHEDYHRPGDEAEKIGYDAVARIGRMLFWLGWEIAQADEPPQWDPEARQRVVDEGR